MYHIDRGAWAEINLDAVAHNVQIAKSNLDPHTKLCAVVKADAYGHGAVAVAREAEKNGADFLAVALLQEGLELREAGIRLPILVLGSLQPGAANVVVQFDISHAVFDEERLYALNEAAVKLNKKARIHIAIDTGMHRIGVHVAMRVNLRLRPRRCLALRSKECSRILQRQMLMTKPMPRISLNASRKR